MGTRGSKRNLQHSIDNWRRTREMGAAAGPRDPSPYLAAGTWALALHFKAYWKNMRAQGKRFHKLADHGTWTVAHQPGQHLVEFTGPMNT